MTVSRGNDSPPTAQSRCPTSTSWQYCSVPGVKILRYTGLALKLLDIIDEKKESLQSSDLTGSQRASGKPKPQSSLQPWNWEGGWSIPQKGRSPSPVTSTPLVRHYADRQQEHFMPVSLNGAHEVLSIGVVSIGLVNRTIVHPRDVLSQLLIQKPQVKWSRNRPYRVLKRHNAIL